MVHHQLFNLIFDHFDFQLRIHFFFIVQVEIFSFYHKSHCKHDFDAILNVTIFLVYMCYDDETCTTTCPSSRRRRDAQRALGIFRRETIDEVDFQDNGLPGWLIFLV